MKTGVSAFDAMTKLPITVKPTTDLVTCAECMAKNDVGSLIIKDSTKLVGIITEKDFVRRIVAKNLDPKKVQVKEVMIKDVITIEPHEDIYFAIKKMVEHNIKHLPVVKDGKLIGLLTWRDVLKLEPQLFELYVEKFRIREEKEKMEQEERYVEGHCESCGAFSQLSEYNGQLICENCKEEST